MAVPVPASGGQGALHLFLPLLCSGLFVLHYILTHRSAFQPWLLICMAPRLHACMEELPLSAPLLRRMYWRNVQQACVSIVPLGRQVTLCTPDQSY